MRYGYNLKGLWVIFKLSGLRVRSVPFMLWCYEMIFLVEGNFWVVDVVNIFMAERINVTLLTSKPKNLCLFCFVCFFYYFLFCCLFIQMWIADIWNIDICHCSVCFEWSGIWLVVLKETTSNTWQNKPLWNTQQGCDFWQETLLLTVVEVNFRYCKWVNYLY